MSRRRKLASEQLAAHFFQRDYHDRGMLKWGGFFLSDHTVALKHDANQTVEPRHEAMSLIAISEQLLVSWQEKQTIKVQLNVTDEQERQLTTVTGMVVGMADEVIVLQVAKEYYKLALDEIRWVALTTK